MPITVPPVVLPSRPASPPRRYGLLDAANGPIDMPLAQVRNGGLSYISATCGTGFGYEIACIDAQADKGAFFGDGVDIVTGTPFIIGTTLTCGSVGFTEAEYRAMAMERLASVEQAELERIFSSDTVGQGPSLTAADGIITVTGGGSTVSHVISHLEQARYCGFGANTAQYGVPGVLHLPVAVFNQAKQDGLLEFDGTRWRTAMGTFVSTGCYANEDPAGAAPADGTFWVYITGQVYIWRSTDVLISPIEGALNRTTNQVRMMVEREYVVAYECGGFAKAVTLWTP